MKKIKIPSYLKRDCEEFEILINKIYGFGVEGYIHGKNRKEICATPCYGHGTQEESIRGQLIQKLVAKKIDPVYESDRPTLWIKKDHLVLVGEKNYIAKGMLTGLLGKEGYKVLA